MYVCMYLSIYLFIYLSIYPTTNISIHLSIHLSNYLLRLLLLGLVADRDGPELGSLVQNLVGGSLLLLAYVQLKGVNTFVYAGIVYNRPIPLTHPFVCPSLDQSVSQTRALSASLGVFNLVSTC